MSLYLGQSESAADLIATLLSDSEIIDIMDRLLEPQIGTIRLALNAHAAADNLQIPLAQSITTSAVAAQFKNGWAYTNGAYISKRYFPKAYDLLKNSGMEHDANNVRLPNLHGFLYAASTKESNNVPVFYHDPQRYGSPSHFHDFNFSSSSTTIDEGTLIRNASWIWSTRYYGGGFETQTDTIVSGYTIPAHTPSAHSGHHSTKINNLLVWDIPVNVNSTSSSRINVDTGYSVSDHPYITSGEIKPKHIIMNSVIYIGKPENLP